MKGLKTDQIGKVLKMLPDVNKYRGEKALIVYNAGTERRPKVRSFTFKKVKVMNGRLSWFFVKSLKY